MCRKPKFMPATRADAYRELSTSMHSQRRPVRLAALIMCLGASACLLGACSGACAVVLDPRSVQSETLKNGLRLIVAPDPNAAVVAIEVVVKVGAADDSPDQSGTAHLLEHVLWASGTAADEDPRLRIERVGGVTDAGTLRDYTRFYATVPAEYLAEAVEALSEIVLSRRFDDEMVNRERQIVLEESSARVEDPRAVLNDLAFADIYAPDHPYAAPICGTIDDLLTIDVARLMLFHEKWYLPNNMAVVLCGDVSFDAAREAAIRVFGDLRPAAVPSRSWPRVPRPGRTSERVVDMPVERAYVMGAFVGPDVSERSHVCASDLLATLLTHGPLSRLGSRLKEQAEIALDVGVDFLTQRDRALFGVWAVCSPDDISEVKATIRSEIQRLAQEPIPGQELASAKRLLAAGYAFANETPTDRATTLGFYEAIDSYRIASYYLSWVAYGRFETLIEVAGWYSGEPVWIILRPKEHR